jgi:hypothetical protein
VPENVDHKKDIMNNNTKRIGAVIGIGLALMLPINRAFAQSPQQLSAEWEQWALSIPTSVNPTLDTTGQYAVVGQRGPIWFLAGFSGGGTVTRTCSVPEGKSLYFPAINYVNINTPNVCGQDSNNIPVSKLRADAATVIDATKHLSATLDGKQIKNLLQRVQSEVFSVALPEENIFDKPCEDGGLGNVPGGIYSPAVDDGFYVLLNPLSIGKHALHFHAENSSLGITEDVTYNLTVVPVL